MKYPITTQKEIRSLFWQTYPFLNRKKIVKFGDEKTYVTDTRVAFCDFVENLRRDGQISEALAYRVTL